MLRIGSTAPDLTLRDHEGRPFRLADAWSDKHVVLFFYPKAHTSVCTKEACAFRDALANITAKGAVIIGLIAGPACYAASVWIKKLLRYDDSLDAFGIHGAGGLVGALLTGVFASTAINSLSEGATVMNQAIGLGWTIAYSAVGTFVILLICKFTTGLRVSAAGEEEGLDTHLHGEALEGV